MKTLMKPLLLCMMTVLMLSGCALPGLSGSSENTVKIGTVTTSETQTIGYIQKYMIEHYTDLNAEVITNLGSSVVMNKANINGDIDISAVRYTGTDISGALGLDLIKDPKEALEIVQREFKKQFNQKWYDSYGFANTYAVAVRGEEAKSKNLNKISDLKPYAPKYKFGVDNSWINREGVGYEPFTKTFGFKFDSVFPMQIGLVYTALANKKMDAVLAYSTDARLKLYNLKLLDDDKHFFPPYDASPVIGYDLLKKHPELDKVLQKLVGKIDSDTVLDLNYQADVESKEPSTIAKEFVEKHNYFENE
ncbi:osmoprotectant ABC transporter substrate-binding protein [Terrilactibacillus sp. BCM23-1]|uniref:Osmoprotectant ABC transporter substrate-binding protein n=1 Tax=Terrilactibacillus tamarindi TaxID=2599694 RepID=A0A6N8CQA8_9BACI|nr:osmoprotectant ABC transporter substrate-binding protein [Terrilactibacillus tamarindi]MTT32221.1 osmoprotectant ABC transporter substrate-binding protein [Terrilactibacillus tamarindi]